MRTRFDQTQVSSLAQELIRTEGLSHEQALRKAADLLPALISYADQWEAGASDAGNHAADNDEE